MAGLLTYSLFTAFPPRRCETVALNGKQTERAYSSGNCSGFAPDSLFILKPGRALWNRYQQQRYMNKYCLNTLLKKN